MKTEKTARVRGVGHFFANPETSGLVVGEEFVSLASLAGGLGAEVEEVAESAYDYATATGDDDWAGDRAEYEQRTGRKHPRVYEVDVRVRLRELPDAEAVSYWAARARDTGASYGSAQTNPEAQAGTGATVTTFVGDDGRVCVRWKRGSLDLPHDPMGWEVKVLHTIVGFHTPKPERSPAIGIRLSPSEAGTTANVLEIDYESPRVVLPAHDDTEPYVRRRMTNNPWIAAAALAEAEHRAAGEG